MKPVLVEAPPAPQIGKRPKRPKYYTIARHLKVNPGQWWHIMDDSTSATATLIKKGGLVSFKPAGAFEAVSRKNNKGKADIYARYVGESITEEPAGEIESGLA